MRNMKDELTITAAKAAQLAEEYNAATYPRELGNLYDEIRSWASAGLRSRSWRWEDLPPDVVEAIKEQLKSDGFRLTTPSYKTELIEW
jgi:hypothetical protein